MSYLVIHLSDWESPIGVLSTINTLVVQVDYVRWESGVSDCIGGRRKKSETRMTPSVLKQNPNT